MLNESPCEIDKIKVIKFLTHFTVAPCSPLSVFTKLAIKHDCIDYKCSEISLYAENPLWHERVQLCVYTTYHSVVGDALFQAVSSTDHMLAASAICLCSSMSFNSVWYSLCCICPQILVSQSDLHVDDHISDKKNQFRCLQKTDCIKRSVCWCMLVLLEDNKLTRESYVWQLESEARFTVVAYNVCHWFSAWDQLASGPLTLT